MCLICMLHFLIKSFGLPGRPTCFSVYLVPPARPQPTMLQFMTQTNLTLIGLNEIQSNENWIQGLHIQEHTHTHAQLVARTKSKKPTLFKSTLIRCLSARECIVGNLPSGGGYYITASASTPGPTRQAKLPWLQQWKIKTTLEGVQSIMEIQKASSSCE